MYVDWVKGNKSVLLVCNDGREFVLILFFNEASTSNHMDNFLHAGSEPKIPYKDPAKAFW